MQHSTSEGILTGLALESRVGCQQGVMLLIVVRYMRACLPVYLYDWQDSAFLLCNEYGM